MADKNMGKESSGFEEQVVNINRCSKVVKGGRNFSFAALVVVGDRNGQVGIGHGKANEVADAIRKGNEAARRELMQIPIEGTTIPHAIQSKFRGAKVFMKPASKGTGLIAGGAIRAVLDLGGVKDVLAKSMGSNNPVNVVKATVKAINSMSMKKDAEAKRGISL